MHQVYAQWGCIIFGGIATTPRYRADDSGDTLRRGSPLAHANAYLCTGV